MQKIILILVGLTFLGIIFFIQTREDVPKDTKKISTIIQTNIISKPIENKVNKAPKSTPFKPLIKTLTSATSNNDIVVQSLKELEMERFKEIQTQINTQMLKIPECLENAQTKEEAFTCSNTLRKLHKELAISMGDFSEHNITGYDDTFVWNEETKIDMIKEIENSAEHTEEMKTCMETSSNSEEFQECLGLELKDK